jgi:hypothetical protein
MSIDNPITFSDDKGDDDRQLVGTMYATDTIFFRDTKINEAISPVNELISNGIIVIPLVDTNRFVSIFSNFFKDAPDSPTNVKQNGLAGVSNGAPMNLRNDGQLSSMSSIFGPTRDLHSSIISQLSVFQQDLMNMLDRKYIRHIPGPLYVIPTGMPETTGEGTWSQSFLSDSSDTQFEAFVVLQGKHHIEYIPNSQMTTKNFPPWVSEKKLQQEKKPVIEERRRLKAHHSGIIVNENEARIKVAVAGDIVIKYTHLKTKALHPNPTETTVIKQFYGFVLSNVIRSMDSVIFEELISLYDIYPNPETAKFQTQTIPYTPFGLLNSQWNLGSANSDLKGMEELSTDFPDDFTHEYQPKLRTYRVLKKNASPDDMLKSNRLITYSQYTEAEFLSMLYGKGKKEKMQELKFWSKPIYDRISNKKSGSTPQKSKTIAEKPISSISSTQDPSSKFQKTPSVPRTSNTIGTNPNPSISSPQDISYKKNMDDLLLEGITVIDVPNHKQILHTFDTYFKLAPDSPKNVKEQGFAGVTADYPMTLRSDGGLTSMSSIYGPSRDLHARLVIQLVEFQNLLKKEMADIDKRDGKIKPNQVIYIRHIPGPLYVCPPNVTDNSIKENEWIRSFFPDNSHMQFEAYMVLQGNVMVEYVPRSQMRADSLPAKLKDKTVTGANVHKIVSILNDPTKIITVKPGQIVIKYTHLVTKTLPPNTSDLTVIKQFYGFVLSRTVNSMHLEYLKQKIKWYDNYPSSDPPRSFIPKGKTNIPKTPFELPNTQWENDPDGDTAQLMQGKSSKFKAEYKQDITVDGKKYNILKKITRPDDILTKSNGEVRYKRMAPREIIQMVYGLNDDEKMDNISRYDQPIHKRLQNRINSRKCTSNDSNKHNKRRREVSLDKSPPDGIALPPKTKKPKENAIELKDVVSPPVQPKKRDDLAGPPIYDFVDKNLKEERRLQMLRNYQQTTENDISEHDDIELDNGKEVTVLLNGTPTENLKVTLKYSKDKGNSVYATKPIFVGETVALLELQVYDKAEVEGDYKRIMYDQMIPAETGDSFLDKLYGTKFDGSIQNPTVDHVPYWGFFVKKPFEKSNVADGTVDEKANVYFVFDRNKNYQKIFDKKKRKTIEIGDILTYRFVAKTKIDPGTEILWSRHILDLEPSHTIPSHLMDFDAINKSNAEKEMKVILQHTKEKGVSIFAIDEIKRGNYVAHYKVKIYENNLREYNEYEIGIPLSDKSGLDNRTFGDIFEDSLPETGEDGVPYYGYFANEPTFGVDGERENVKLVPNETLTKYNGDNGDVELGQPIIMSLKATRNIKRGQEIMWVYGDDLYRGYKPGRQIPSDMIERDSLIENYSVPEANKESLVEMANELMKNGIVVIPYLDSSKLLKEKKGVKVSNPPEKYIIKLLGHEMAKSQDTPDYFRQLQSERKKTTPSNTRSTRKDIPFGFHAIKKNKPLTLNPEGIMGTFSSVYNPISRDLHSQITSEFLTQFYYRLFEHMAKIYIRHIIPTLEIPVVSSAITDLAKDTYFGSIQQDNTRHQYIMILPLTAGQKFRFIKKSKLDHTEFKEFIRLKTDDNHEDYTPTKSIGEGKKSFPTLFIRDHDPNETDEYMEITIPVGHLLIFQSHLLHTKIIDTIDEKVGYAIRLVSGFAISGSNDDATDIIIPHIQKSLREMTMPRFSNGKYMTMRPEMTNANQNVIITHSKHYDEKYLITEKKKSILPKVSPEFKDLYPPMSKQELGRTGYSIFSMKLYLHLGELAKKRVNDQFKKDKDIYEKSDDLIFGIKSMYFKIASYLTEYIQQQYFNISNEYKNEDAFEKAKKNHQSHIIDNIIFENVPKIESGGSMKLDATERKTALLNFGSNTLTMLVTSLQVELTKAYANHLKSFTKRVDHYEEFGRHLRKYIQKATEVLTEKKTDLSKFELNDQSANHTTVKKKKEELKDKAQQNLKTLMHKYNNILENQNETLADGIIAQIIDKERIILKLIDESKSRKSNGIEENDDDAKEQIAKLQKELDDEDFDDLIFTKWDFMNILIRMLRNYQDKENYLNPKFIVILPEEDCNFLRKLISDQSKELKTKMDYLTNQINANKKTTGMSKKQMGFAKKVKAELGSLEAEYNVYVGFIKKDRQEDLLDSAIEYLNTIEIIEIQNGTIESVNVTMTDDIIDSFDKADKDLRKSERKTNAIIYFYPFYIKWIKELEKERESLREKSDTNEETVLGYTNEDNESDSGDDYHNFGQAIALIKKNKWGKKHNTVLNETENLNAKPEETHARQPGDLDLDTDIYVNVAFDAYDYPPTKTDVTWLPPVETRNFSNIGVEIPLSLIRSNKKKNPPLKPIGKGLELRSTHETDLPPKDSEQKKRLIKGNGDSLNKDNRDKTDDEWWEDEPLASLRSNPKPNRTLQVQPPANIPEFELEDKMEDSWMDETLASLISNRNLTPKTIRPLQIQSPANVSELQSGDGNDLESVRKGKQPRPKEVSSTSFG